ncbi:MAG: hypothetical protein ACREBT_06460, partial [Thermoplasmata archaeon]
YGSVTSPQSFTAVSPTSTTHYCASIEDNATTSVTQSTSATLVAVNDALSVPRLSPSATQTIDNGQTVVFSVSWTGGSSPITATLYSGTSATCSSDTTLVQTAESASSPQSFLAVSPTSNTYYCASVLDSASLPATGSSGTVQVIVNPTLGTPILSPSTTQTFDTSQTIAVAFSASWIGGTSPFVAALYSGNSSKCSDDTALVEVLTDAASPQSFSAVSPSSSTYYCASITDQATTPVAESTGATQVIVNPVLGSAVLSPPTTQTIAIGQTVTFSVSWTGGSSPFTATLYWGASATCSSGTTVVQEVSSATSPQSFSAVAPTSSTYYCASVKDAATTPVTQFTGVTQVVLGGGYAVTFNETGLPAGTSWTVTLNGANETSSTANITFGMPDGSFAYSIGSLAYLAEPSSGMVTVAGAPLKVSVTFVVAYPVTISRPGGVSPGTLWNATLVGETSNSSVSTEVVSGGTFFIDVAESTTGPSITFLAPAGSYTWSITVPSQPSYFDQGAVAPSPSNPNPIVVPAALSPAATPLLLVILPYLALAILAALVAFMVFYVARRRRHARKGATWRGRTFEANVPATQLPVERAPVFFEGYSPGELLSSTHPEESVSDAPRVRYLEPWVPGPESESPAGEPSPPSSPPQEASPAKEGEVERPGSKIRRAASDS